MMLSRTDGAGSGRRGAVYIGSLKAGAHPPPFVHINM